MFDKHGAKRFRIIIPLVCVFLLLFLIAIPRPSFWYHPRKSSIKELPTASISVGSSEVLREGINVPLPKLDLEPKQELKFGIFSSLSGQDLRKILGLHLKLIKASDGEQKVFKSKKTGDKFFLKRIKETNKESDKEYSLFYLKNKAKQKKLYPLFYFSKNLFDDPSLLVELSKRKLKELVEFKTVGENVLVNILNPKVIDLLKPDFVIGVFQQKQRRQFKAKDLLFSLSVTIEDQQAGVPAAEDLEPDTKDSGISTEQDPELVDDQTPKVEEPTTESPFESTKVILPTSVFKALDFKSAENQSFALAASTAPQLPSGTKLTIVRDEERAVELLASEEYQAGFFEGILPDPEYNGEPFAHKAFDVVLAQSILVSDLNDAIELNDSIIGITAPYSPAVVTVEKLRADKPQNARANQIVKLTNQVRNFFKAELDTRELSTVALLSTGIAQQELNNLRLTPLKYLNLHAQSSEQDLAHKPWDQSISGIGTTLGFLLAGKQQQVKYKDTSYQLSAYSPYTELAPFKVLSARTNANEYVSGKHLFDYIRAVVNHTVAPDVLVLPHTFGSKYCDPLIMHALWVAGQKTGDTYKGVPAIVSLGDHLFVDPNKNKIAGFVSFPGKNTLPTFNFTSNPSCAGLLNSVVSVGALETKSGKLWHQSNDAILSDVIFSPGTSLLSKGNHNKVEVVSGVEHALASVTTAASLIQLFFKQQKFDYSARDIKDALLSLAVRKQSYIDARFKPEIERQRNIVDFSRLVLGLKEFKSKMEADPSGYQARKLLSRRHSETGLGYNPDLQSTIESLNIGLRKYEVTKPGSLPIGVKALKQDGRYNNLAPYSWCTVNDPEAFSITPYKALLHITEAAFQSDTGNQTGAKASMLCHYQDETNKYFTSNTVEVNAVPTKSTFGSLLRIRAELPGFSQVAGVYQIPAMLGKIPLHVIATYKKNGVEHERRVERLVKLKRIGDKALTFIGALRVFSSYYAQANTVGSYAIRFADQVTKKTELRYKITPRAVDSFYIYAPKGTEIFKGPNNGQFYKLYASVRVPQLERPDLLETKRVRANWSVKDSKGNEIFAAKSKSSIRLDTRQSYLKPGEYTVSARYASRSEGQREFKNAEFKFKVIWDSGFLELLGPGVVQAGQSAAVALRVHPSTESNSYFVADPKGVSYKILNYDGSVYQGQAISIDTNGVVHTKASILNGVESKKFKIQASFANEQAEEELAVVEFNGYTGTRGRPVSLTAQVPSQVSYSDYIKVDPVQAIYENGRVRSVRKYASYYSSDPSGLTPRKSNPEAYACQSYTLAVHYEGVESEYPVEVVKTPITSKHLEVTDEVGSPADCSYINKDERTSVSATARVYFNSVQHGRGNSLRLPGTASIIDSSGNVVMENTSTSFGVPYVTFDISNLAVGDYQVRFSSPHYKGNCIDEVVEFGPTCLKVYDNRRDIDDIKVRWHTGGPRNVLHGERQPVAVIVKYSGQKHYRRPLDRDKFTVELRDADTKKKLGTSDKFDVSEIERDTFRYMYWGSENLDRKIEFRISHVGSSAKSQWFIDRSVGFARFPNPPQPKVDLPQVGSEDRRASNSVCSLPLSMNEPRFRSGTGTAEDPFIVCDTEFRNLYTIMMAEIERNRSYYSRRRRIYFKQGESIDFNGEQVDPFIGNLVPGHTLIYDGDNREIKNYTIYDAENPACLFESFYNAIVKNLVLRSPLVRGEKAGALVCNIDKTTLSNIKVINGNIRGDAVGGLVAYARGSKVVESLVSASEVVGDRLFAAGLIGTADTTCVAHSLVQNTNVIAGGVAGIGGVYAGVIAKERSRSVKFDEENQIIDNLTRCDFQAGESGDLFVADSGFPNGNNYYTAGTYYNVHHRGGTIRANFDAEYGTAIVGGLIGDINGGSVIASSHTGNITAQGSGVGLLVGKIKKANMYGPSGAIAFSSAQGTVIAGVDSHGTSNAGGLVGILDQGSVLFDSNKVTSSVIRAPRSGVGGLLGTNARWIRAYDNHIEASARNTEDVPSLGGDAGGFVGLRIRDKEIVTIVPSIIEADGNTWSKTSSPGLKDIGKLLEIEASNRTEDDRGIDEPGITAVN